jgi:hypothetical protein
MLVSLCLLARYGMKVGWEQAHVGHGDAFGFSAALLDDWFV